MSPIEAVGVMAKAAEAINIKVDLQQILTIAGNHKHLSVDAWKNAIDVFIRTKSFKEMERWLTEDVEPDFNVMSVEEFKNPYPEGCRRVGDDSGQS
jgi:hypothetical protein